MRDATTSVRDSGPILTFHRRPSASRTSYPGLKPPCFSSTNQNVASESGAYRLPPTPQNKSRDVMSLGSLQNCCICAGPGGWASVDWKRGAHAVPPSSQRTMSTRAEARVTATSGEHYPGTSPDVVCESDAVFPLRCRGLSADTRPPHPLVADVRFARFLHPHPRCFTSHARQNGPDVSLRVDSGHRSQCR